MTRKTTKIDLHTHTRGSDGIGTPEQIARYAVEAGLDGICLTDHHLTYTPENLEVARACREAGLLVIHGCEYSTANGHLLVYGVNIEDLNLPHYPPMQDVIDAVNKHGGVCVPSHPYKGYRKKLCDDVKKLKGVPAYETANGQVAYREPWTNAKALKAAKTTGKKTTGGSDAHNPRDIGLTFTEFAGQITTEKEFLAALKRGSYRAVTARKRVEKEAAYRRSLYANPTKGTGLELSLARARMKRAQGKDTMDPANRTKYGLPPLGTDLDTDGWTGETAPYAAESSWNKKTGPLFN